MRVDAERETLAGHEGRLVVADMGMARQEEESNCRVESRPVESNAR